MLGAVSMIPEVNLRSRRNHDANKVAARTFFIRLLEIRVIPLPFMLQSTNRFSSNLGPLNECSEHRGREDSGSETMEQRSTGWSGMLTFGYPMSIRMHWLKEATLGLNSRSD